MQTTTPALVGRGTSVHTLEGRWTAPRPLTVCGASYSATGNRAMQSAGQVDGSAEVTCKRCIKAVDGMSATDKAACGIA